VSGKVAPETVKPAPVATAEFTVTGTEPVELSVTYFVTAAFRTPPPKDRLVALTVNVGVDDPNWSETALETPPALAVIVAV
jgi:hypothetical protein